MNILKKITIGSVFAIAAAQLHASTTPTETSLIVSAGNSVSADTVLVNAGNIVTLTAKVSASGQPVTLGTVKFCNTAVTSCEFGSGLYGSAQLTSAGTATLKMSFAAGMNTVRAVFVSANANSTSNSSSVAISVNPLRIFPSVTSLTSSGSTGNYTLSGIVSAPGRQPLTGTVGFTDLSNGNLQLPAASLGLSTRSFGAITKYSTGGGYPNLSFVAVGDFNGDGKQDLAVTNQLNKTVSILLGNGDGSFQPEIPLPTGTGPVSVSVGDLNGDGEQDFVVANQDGTVSVFLGNGDGTFQTSVPYTAGPAPVFVVLGDFNGDGRQDVIVANGGGSSSTVTVLLGDGNGKLQPGLSYQCGVNPSSIAVGDFNRDGNQDLIVSNFITGAPGTVSVLLGNGDGTFKSPRSYPVGNNPSFVVVGDFDGDGNQDFAVTSGVIDGQVSVLMGDGHGTFQLLDSYPTGKNPSSLSVGDFDGDGVEDLVIAGSSSTVSVYLGIGDGKFQPSSAPAVAGAQIIAVGDFNGDGMDDLVATNGEVAVVSTLLGVQQASYSVSGISVIGPGKHAVFASYSGDSSRIASQSKTVILTGTPGTATVSMVSAPNPSIVGTVVTLSALLTGADGIEPAGIITFKDGATTIGTGTILGASASVTTANLSVGTHLITAVYGGDDNYYGSSSLPLAQVVNNKIETSISLTSSADPSTYGGNITFTATVSSGVTGTVTFVDGASVLGSVSLNAFGQAAISVASLTAGAHNITATYSGDSSHF